MADQPIQVVPGQAYGMRKAQEDAQRAIPLPQSAGPSESSIVPLGAPSQRPGEHVMTGSPAGPGPGPEQLGIPSAVPGTSDVYERIQVLAQMYPTPELLDLLADFHLDRGR